MTKKEKCKVLLLTVIIIVSAMFLLMCGIKREYVDAPKPVLSRYRV